MSDRSATAVGYIDNGEGRKTVGRLIRVDFSLANFPSFLGDLVSTDSEDAPAGRASLVSRDWTLTLDAVPAPFDTFNDPSVEGGYVITHAGRLERTDNAEFSVDDARAVLTDLYWFFSFCRGKPSAAALPVGISAQGSHVWTDWSSVSIGAHSSQSATGWLNLKNTSGLRNLFARFFDKLREPVWAKSLPLAIYWYLEASSVGGDSTLILAQAAFELIAWNALVKGAQPISKSAFDKLTAEGELRKMLELACVPLDIPKTLTALAALAAASGWADGPKSLVGVRNALVHPTKEKNEKSIDRLDGMNLFEASVLSLWYLELLILYIAGYSGDYSNRTIRTGFRGQEVEPVPWPT